MPSLFSVLALIISINIPFSYAHYPLKQINLSNHPSNSNICSKVPNRLSLFRDNATGDYSIMYIYDNGLVSFTHYQNKILKNRRSKLKKDYFNEIFLKLNQNNFFEMKERYEPQQEGFYEDTYYTLTLILSDKRKSVTAHEHGMPNKFAELISLFTEIKKQIPNNELYGYFIKASKMQLEEKINEKKVLTNREVKLKILNKNLKIYRLNSLAADLNSILSKAICSPEAFIFIDSDKKNLLDEMLSPASKNFYLDLNGQLFLINLYSRKGVQHE